MSTPEDLSNLDPAFDGVLRPVAAGATSCEYFQDRNKRWPFHCDDEGYRLWRACCARRRRWWARCAGKDRRRVRRGGQVRARRRGRGRRRGPAHLRARKPNMGEHDVTWSQLEYGHLGLQKEYIWYKSVQRLTEAWACLQTRETRRAFLRAGRDASDGKREPLRAVAVGVARRRPRVRVFLAVKWFFEKHFPRYALDLVSLDLEASWREAAEGLGLRFSTWDVRDGDGLEAPRAGP